MDRVRFLKNAGLVIGAGMLSDIFGYAGDVRVNGLTGNSDLSSAFTNENILVLIQLLGGNDGLNTVVPLESYDHLAGLRPRILVPEKKLLRPNDEVALHPALEKLSHLFRDEKLSIVQGVGYPNQNRSHFRSFDIWSTASSAEATWTTGWLGRYLEKLNPDYPGAMDKQEAGSPLSISIGNMVSEACQGSKLNYSVAVTDPEDITELPEELIPASGVQAYADELEFLRTTVHQANRYGQTILQAYAKGANRAAYPADNKLAVQLGIVARLISGGLKTKIYVLSLGGFDTHANQVLPDDASNGMHAHLLQTLADAIGAFQHDLDALGVSRRVLGMTISEFGRQICSNDSLGTDHGSAGPLFLFGDAVSRSMVGTSPRVDKQVEDQAGIPMQIDFRNVYGSILADWFGLPAEHVRSLLFPGFEPLPLIRALS